MTSRRFVAQGAALLISTACATSLRPAAVSAAGGGPVYVDDAPGRSVPVVFVHGDGGSTKQWRAQLDRFRQAGRRAVAVDLPGFGRFAPPPGGDWSLPSMADAVERAADAAHRKRFVLVGHGYGGAVVAAYAARRPDWITGVAYVDAVVATLPLTPEQQAQFGAALSAERTSRAGWPRLSPGSSSRSVSATFL